MEKDTRSHEIIGAAIEVHNIIGPGKLEAVYQECLGIELEKYYIPDFIVFGEIVLEIKAAKTLAKEDEAQIINSLKIGGHQIGLLINFGEASL